jgi:hypothetical protein
MGPFKAQIVSNLSRAINRVIESYVEAVDKDEGLFAVMFVYSLAHGVVKRPFFLLCSSDDDKVLGRIFFPNHGLGVAPARRTLRHTIFGPCESHRSFQTAGSSAGH